MGSVMTTSPSDWSFPEIGDLLKTETVVGPKTVLVISQLGVNNELGGRLYVTYSVLNLATKQREVIIVSWNDCRWLKI